MDYNKENEDALILKLKGLENSIICSKVSIVHNTETNSITLTINSELSYSFGNINNYNIHTHNDYTYVCICWGKVKTIYKVKTSNYSLTKVAGIIF